MVGPSCCSCSHRFDCSITWRQARHIKTKATNERICVERQPVQGFRCTFPRLRFCTTRHFILVLKQPRASKLSPKTHGCMHGTTVSSCCIDVLQHASQPRRWLSSRLTVPDSTIISQSAVRAEKRGCPRRRKLSAHLLRLVNCKFQPIASIWGKKETGRAQIAGGLLSSGLDQSSPKRVSCPCECSKPSPSQRCIFYFPRHISQTLNLISHARLVWLRLRLRA